MSLRVGLSMKPSVDQVIVLGLGSHCTGAMSLSLLLFPYGLSLFVVQKLFSQPLILP